MTSTKLLLVDDHPLVLESIKQLLQDKFTILASITDPQDVIQQAIALRPDVVLLDACFSAQKSWGVLAQIRTSCPKVKIVMVTMLGEAIYVSEAFRLGAHGYVLKQSASDELHEAIRTVMANKRYLSKTIAQEVRETIEDEWMRSEGYSGELSSRQQEVLQLLGSGRSTKFIAQTLKISQKTVEFHRMNMVRKLGVRTTAELVKFALDRGIITI